MLHALITEWHHHAICFSLAIDYLRHRYPGMPASWYRMYEHYVTIRNYSPRNW